MNKNLILTLATMLSVEQNEEVVTAKIKAILDENNALKLASIESQKTRVNDLVQSAIDANKILPTEKETYLELATSNFDATKKILDARKPLVSLASQINNTPGPEDTGTEDRSKWTYNDWSKNDPKGLLRLKTNDKAKYNALVDEVRRKVAAKGGMNAND